jgi:hypothetical protein
MAVMRGKKERRADKGKNKAVGGNVTFFALLHRSRPLPDLASRNRPSRYNLHVFFEGSK